MKGTEEPKVKVARLRASKALWNNISVGKTVTNDQMSKGLAFQMSKPDPMTPAEVAVAEKNGLEVEGQYVLTR